MVRICPICGGRASEEAWQNEVHKRKADVIVAAIPAPVTELV